MTEEIAATPGWVDQRLDEILASVPSSPELAVARDRYAVCLADRKTPGAPSDMLGAEFNGCRSQLHNALLGLGLTGTQLTELDWQIESLEAEIAESS